MEYSNNVMENFYNPKNFSVIKGADAVGKLVSDLGSEIFKFFFKIENDKIVDCQFQTFGGILAIAVSSIATEMVIGKNIKDIDKITTKNFADIVGEIPENKNYILQAVVTALKKGIYNYQNKVSEE